MAYMNYDWRNPSLYKGISAQVAGEICEDLAAENRLTGEELVEISRDEDAPLHPAFEWDDVKAAEKWRVHQGNGIIRNLTVTVIKEETPVTVRANYKIYTEEQRKYETIAVIMSDEAKRKSLLATATKELKSYRRKYEILADELADVFAAIDQLDDDELGES